MTQPEPISLEEWLAYLSSDKEFRLKAEFSATSPKGETIRCRAPGLAEWIDPVGGSKALFDHRPSGRITVGNPSRQTLAKMFKVAGFLKAVVQGEEGECHEASGRAF